MNTATGQPSLRFATTGAVWLSQRADLLDAEVPAVGNDEVRLRDGTRVRGYIIEEKPREYVRILVYGEEVPRRYEWSEIDVVLPGVSASEGASGSTRDSTTGVHVDLELDRPPPGSAHLVRIAGSVQGVAYGGGSSAVVNASYLEDVCAAPCSRVVNNDDEKTYFVSGPRMMPTSAFKLPRSGDVSIRVQVKGIGYRRGGAALTMLSVGFFTAGIVLLTFGGVNRAVYEDGSAPARKATGMLVGGSLLTLGAIGSFAGGVALLRKRSGVTVLPR